MNRIIPSIIAKNQKEFEKRIRKVKNDFSLLQLDVMDGKFVKNKSLNFNFKLPKTKCKYEAQLMINNPEAWIDEYWEKVGTIIFHFKSVKAYEIENLIKKIKSKKRKVGIAIKPSVKIKEIKSYLDKIDVVLVMTVNPGSYGGKFLPSTLKKVKELRKLKPKLNIEVDGGINNKTIFAAKSAGANIFVSGSYLQESKDIKFSKGVLKLLKGGKKNE